MKSRAALEDIVSQHVHNMLMEVNVKLYKSQSARDNKQADMVIGS